VILTFGPTYSNKDACPVRAVPARMGCRGRNGV
jgi:hypothetical protein